MDPRRNPYAPGAGAPPPELAGRDARARGDDAPRFHAVIVGSVPPEEPPLSPTSVRDVDTIGGEGGELGAGAGRGSAIDDEGDPEVVDSLNDPGVLQLGVVDAVEQRTGEPVQVPAPDQR